MKILADQFLLGDLVEREREREREPQEEFIRFKLKPL
jgi:hypothetical protein